MPAHIKAPTLRAAALFAAAFLLLLSAFAGAGGSVVLALATRQPGLASRIGFPSIPHAMAPTIVYGMSYLLLFLLSAMGCLAIAQRHRRRVTLFGAALLIEYVVSTILGATAIGLLMHPRNKSTAVHHCTSTVTDIPVDVTNETTGSRLPLFEAGAVTAALPPCMHAYSTIEALVLALWITTRVVEPLAWFAIMAYRRTLPSHPTPNAWGNSLDPEQGTLPPYMPRHDKDSDTETLPAYSPGFSAHDLDEKDEKHVSEVCDVQDLDQDFDDEDDSPWGAAGDSSMVDIDLMAQAAAGEKEQYTTPNEGFKVFYVNMAHHHRPRPRASKISPPPPSTPHTVFTRHAQSMDLPGHSRQVLWSDPVLPATDDNLHSDHTDGKNHSMKQHERAYHKSYHSKPDIVRPRSPKEFHLTETDPSVSPDGPLPPSTSAPAEDVRAIVDEWDPEASSADEEVPGGTYASEAYYSGYGASYEPSHTTSSLEEGRGSSPAALPPSGPTYRAASYATRGIKALGPEPDDSCAASGNAGFATSSRPTKSHKHGGDRTDRQPSGQSTRSSDSEHTIVVTCRVGDEGEDDGKA